VEGYNHDLSNFKMQPSQR